MGEIRAGAGHSTDSDSGVAGREATASAVGDADGATAVYVFTSSEHDVDAVMEGVHAAIDDAGVTGVTVLGTTTAGEIVNTGSYTESVAVLALAGEAIRVGAGHAEFGEDAQTASTDAASAALDGLGSSTIETNAVDREDGTWRPYPRVVGTVFGDYDDDELAMMDGITAVTSPMTVHGGLAADDWKYDGSARVFLDDTLVERGLAVLAQDLDVKSGVAVRHGLETTDTSLTITRMEGEKIVEFDGRPALEAYEDAVGPQVTNDTFRITRPFGFDVGDDERRILVPYDVDEDDGYLLFTGGQILKEGWTGTIMEPEGEDVIAGTEQAVEMALERAGNPDDVAAVMIHDCLCRWFFHSDTASREAELDAIRNHVDEDVPIVGWYTAGELAAPATISAAYNQTAVVWVLTNEPL